MPEKLISNSKSNNYKCICGILGAMEEEIFLIKNEMKIKKTETYANKIFYIGSINEKDIVLVKAGVGTINVAMVTQILITKYKVESILFTGVAGAISPKLRIGDIIISTKTQYHDVNFTPLGYPIGMYPEIKKCIFNCDEKLIKIANKIANKSFDRVFKGKILSGDRFIDNPYFARYLSTRFNALAVEAEGASIGQVCYFNNIPYITIRTISDLSWSYEKATDLFNKHLKRTSLKSQKLMLNIVKHYDL